LILSTFGVGSIVGILSFSKFLHWLLARWQKPTMLVLAGFIIGSLVKVWPWSNKDAIVCSQFVGASTLEETMSAVQGSGLGPDAAQEIFDTTIARYVDHIDPMIGSAVIFALIGFFLVTGIEIAGKVIAKRKAA
jgi:putative membrane protein